jgi:hypothetical protein
MGKRPPAKYKSLDAYLAGVVHQVCPRPLRNSDIGSVLQLNQRGQGPLPFLKLFQPQNVGGRTRPESFRKSRYDPVG